jgi:hypothetical protein
LKGDLSDDHLIGQFVDYEDGCYEVVDEPSWGLLLDDGSFERLTRGQVADLVFHALYDT